MKKFSSTSTVTFVAASKRHLTSISTFSKAIEEFFLHDDIDEQTIRPFLWIDINSPWILTINQYGDHIYPALIHITFINHSVYLLENPSHSLDILQWLKSIKSGTILPTYILPIIPSSLSQDVMDFLKQMKDDEDFLNSYPTVEEYSHTLNEHGLAIQKKVMDQLAFDLNAALNETCPKTNTTPVKSKRRKKRVPPTNNSSTVNIACHSDASDSTTQENLTLRMTCRSEGEDSEVLSKVGSTLLASESDSTPRIDTSTRRRRRRPFKKPSPPIMIATSANVTMTTSDQLMKNRTSGHGKMSSSTVTTASGSGYNGNSTSYPRRRRRHCISEGSGNNNDMYVSVNTPRSSSSSFSITTIGKRKRSARASSRFVHNSHEDLHRPLNTSINECELTLMDDNNRTQMSSSSSLNLSDTDPSPTSNEADDEQSDFPRDESVPNVVKWWEENNNDFDEDEMLPTIDVNLEKLVNGAFTVMLQSSKTSFQNRLKSYITSREILTGNRRTIPDDIKKNISTHMRRQARPLRDYKRSHHSSYNHKRRKYGETNANKTDEARIMPATPISSNNIGHQLLQKFGWQPGFGLGKVSSGIVNPVQVIYRNHRGGLGYETESLKADCETKDDSFNEKMDSENAQ
ncbi:unnamed protein product [Didymodactylos carnosus]|nr:unnamed protein product [Didymodactylos carnosus]CAF3673070.1 unnamed protein product [Didymodactylos carnosus]